MSKLLNNRPSFIKELNANGDKVNLAITNELKVEELIKLRDLAFEKMDYFFSEDIKYHLAALRYSLEPSVLNSICEYIFGKLPDGELYISYDLNETIKQELKFFAFTSVFATLTGGASYAVRGASLGQSVTKSFIKGMIQQLVVTTKKATVTTGLFTAGGVGVGAIYGGYQNFMNKEKDGLTNEERFRKNLVSFGSFGFALGLGQSSLNNIKDILGNVASLSSNSLNYKSTKLKANELKDCNKKIEAIQKKVDSFGSSRDKLQNYMTELDKRIEEASKAASKPQFKIYLADGTEHIVGQAKETLADLESKYASVERELKLLNSNLVSDEILLRLAKKQKIALAKSLNNTKDAFVHIKSFIKTSSKVLDNYTKYLPATAKLALTGAKTYSKHKVEKTASNFMFPYLNQKEHTEQSYNSLFGIPTNFDENISYKIEAREKNKNLYKENLRAIIKSTEELLRTLKSTYVLNRYATSSRELVNTSFLPDYFENFIPESYHIKFQKQLEDKGFSKKSYVSFVGMDLDFNGYAYFLIDCNKEIGTIAHGKSHKESNKEASSTEAVDISLNDKNELTVESHKGSTKSNERKKVDIEKLTSLIKDYCDKHDNYFKDKNKDTRNKFVVATYKLNDFEDDIGSNLYESIIMNELDNSVRQRYINCLNNIDSLNKKR